MVVVDSADVGYELGTMSIEPEAVVVLKTVEILVDLYVVGQREVVTATTCVTTVVMSAGQSVTVGGQWFTVT